MPVIKIGRNGTSLLNTTLSRWTASSVQLRIEARLVFEWRTKSGMAEQPGFFPLHVTRLLVFQGRIVYSQIVWWFFSDQEWTKPVLHFLKKKSCALKPHLHLHHPLLPIHAKTNSSSLDRILRKTPHRRTHSHIGLIYNNNLTEEHVYSLVESAPRYTRGPNPEVKEKTRNCVLNGQRGAKETV